MLKFAVADVKILDSYMVPADANRESRRRIAHRHHFKYTPRAGYLYVRSRMISSRCNDNFDEFPAEEIAKGYKTFIGKPVFVNHHNEDHHRMRGVIIDAALHRDTLPSGAPDTWVEGLMEVDAKRFPRLAKAIVKGDIDRTSMGCDVDYSICSVCANKATNPAEYCAHIPRMKGQRVYRADPVTGKKVGILVREICYGLRFFENSLLVEEPADPTAYFTGVDTSGLDKAASKTAMRDQATCPHDGSWNLHGQCMQCGWSAATGDDEPCDDEWCVEHEAPHTKGEHIDPSHRDPWHEDYQSAEHGVEDAFGEDRHIGEQLLDQQPTGPSKWSSLSVIAAEFAAFDPAPYRPANYERLNERMRNGVDTTLEAMHQAKLMGHKPLGAAVHNREIAIRCKHCPETSYVSYEPQTATEPGEWHVHGEMHATPCEMNPRSPGYAENAGPYQHGERWGDTQHRDWDATDDVKHSLSSLTRHFATLRTMAEDFSIPLSDDDREFYRQMHEQGQMRQEMYEHAQRREVNLSDPTDLKSHLLEAHDFQPGDFWRNSHEQDHEALDEGDDLDRPLRPHELRSLHEHEHRIYPEDFQHSVSVGDSHFHEASKKASGGSNDTMITCDQGHKHWGAGGAAGLLMRHRGHDGQIRYLLQKRGPDVDHPNTYSIPGGALAPGETPVRGAIREGQEEMGALPNLRVRDTHLNDHGGWAYHTVIADVDHQFEPPGDGDEHAGAGWYTPDEIGTLRLHPGFEASWADINERGH